MDGIVVNVDGRETEVVMQGGDEDGKTLVATKGKTPSSVETDREHYVGFARRNQYSRAV